MARYIRNYLGGESNKYQLLPANSGIENSNLGDQITEYNNKLLQRNSLVANSSDQNPLVIDLDHALAAMRKAIVASIDNQVVTLNAQIKNLERSGQQTTTRIAESPAQAKYLLSVERQQKVKESLYLYLLQKREENELSQAFTAYNTRIITPAGGSMLPTAPLKKNIYATIYWYRNGSQFYLGTFGIDAIWGTISARESSGGIMRRKWFVRYPFTVDVFAKNGTSTC